MFSLMEKITLLVTIREPRDAKTPVNYLRGSFISLLDTFSLVNVESVRRYGEFIMYPSCMMNLI